MRVHPRPALLLLAAAPPIPAAHPALWKIADADTTIYLFGTIHLLPAGTVWRDPALDAAVARADTLVVETVLDEEPGRVARILQTMGRAPGLPPLAERVPPGKRPALLALVKEAGLPLDILNGMKTWAAAVVLANAALQRIDLGPQSPGVEPQLEAAFRRSGRPVEGLETPEAQLGFFDRLPAASQRTFLVSALDSPAKTKREFLETIAAWRRGDVAAIEKSFREDPEFTPALRDLLIRQRDRNWAEWIVARLRRPGTTFVAVGAGHLAGEASVQRMLTARGLKVERVQ